MRTTKAHGDTKTLGRANSNICTHFSRWLNQSERKDISDYSDNDLLLFELSSDFSNIMNITEVIRVLDHISTELLSLRPREICRIINHEIDSKAIGFSPHDFNVLREHTAGEEELVTLSIVNVVSHEHSL